MALRYQNGLCLLLWLQNDGCDMSYPPTGTQVREYVAIRGRHPSGALAQIPGGEAVSQSSSSGSYPEEGPLLQPHLAIRDLDDAQLREALEELQLEMARRKGMALPLGSPLGRWWVPAGGGKANLDDGEVALHRGRDGDLESQCLESQSPSVCHLLSTPVARLRLGTSRINTFSSYATPWKTEVSFKQWYHEVQCIKDQYPEAVVWESIIRSLKGQQ